MSEAKHTPGPWKLVKNIRGWFLKTKTGCVLGGINRFPDTAEMACQCEPNAQLIAAAPELLAACELLADYVRRLRPADDWPREYEIASRAIAKAKGGKP